VYSVADGRYMSRALRLAERGRYSTDPNPRVGCVIVADGQVVGEGWHERAGEAHAEIIALERAGPAARGAVVYLSLEPCSHHGRTAPCVDALIAAGVGTVVVATEDPNPRVAGAGLERLAASGIETGCGLMSDQARSLNAGFFTRMIEGRPRIRIKLAASLDGRTAMASGESQWITGPAAREDVQRLRAESSAILTGIGTVRADDPSLNVRSQRYESGGRQPLRVVLDSGLSMSPGARMLQLAGDTLVFCACEPGERGAGLRRAGARVERLPEAGGRVDLPSLMTRLAALECNDVLVEAGPTLCGQLLTAGLVDELLIYVAAHLMGDRGRGLFCLPELESMADRVQLEFEDARRVGPDLRIRVVPAREKS